MAFDDKTRNRLQNFVSEARTLLTEEFTRQLQNDYGLDPETGEVSDIESLSSLDDTRRQTARLLRDILDHYQAINPSPEIRDSLKRIVREQAFTVLNRLCALKMAEARDILIQSTSKGYNSKGFQLYARIAGIALGETGDAYRNYLFSIFDEFELDLPVLFDRYSPMGRLFPRESVLLELLEQINHVEIDPLWAEDETIGWIYQYFNSAKERRQMRDESKAPRNSRELAVRNQFFTPRYVVEFLTDNTLGRIWYEMTQGNTALKDTCRYLVRRPNEMFLARGEEAPEQEDATEDLSQQELLNQPVYIQFRSLKDPREICMLDPACGSMHFGLYAFDLFEQIYKEAWELETRLGDDLFEKTGEFKPLIKTYEKHETFLRDIPRLIIEHNIHGVDIDPRAVQIAGLSLWLRAQRSWKARNIKPLERPKIRKSNIVCAEPMPGEKDLLQDFTKNLKPRVLGQLVEIIFEKMKLAGEAGSLLKIENEIKESIEKAREEFNRELLQRKQKGQKTLFPGLAKAKQLSLFDFTDLPSKTEFWQTAVDQILNALENYAEYAESLDSTHRLFAEDAARGFAFIALCRKFYDVILMNPPFGEFSKQWKAKARATYPNSYNDILAAFVDRAGQILHHCGNIGAITSRTCFFLLSFNRWRKHVVLSQLSPKFLVDLGSGVMDAAMVEAAAYVLEKNDPDRTDRNKMTTFRLLDNQEHTVLLNDAIISLIGGTPHPNIYIVKPSSFTQIPNASFAYWVSERIRHLFVELPSFEGNGRTVKQGLATADDFRFVRTTWETQLEHPDDICRKWFSFSKGGSYVPFYMDIHLKVNWAEGGKEIYVFNGIPLGGAGAPIRNPTFYFRPGLTWPRRSSRMRAAPVPAGCIFSHAGMMAFTDKLEKLPSVCGIMGSAPFDMLCRLRTGSHGGSQFEVGIIQTNPVPCFDNVVSSIKSYVLSSWAIAKNRDTSNLTSQAFYAPALCRNEGTLSANLKQWADFLNSTKSELSTIQDQIDDLAYDLYGISDEDRRAAETTVFNGPCLDDKNDIAEPVVDAFALVSELFDYSIGTAFGRWDIRFSTAELQAPELNNPFNLLPTCPPGMLQNAKSLPAEPRDVPVDYPIRITWPGIMVDDEGHSEDIITRLREVFEVVWKHKSGEIEQESCEIIGVNSLLEYFNKSNGFFADHLKRYSKSRRQAPIYWPLSTPSSSYTLWIYYHRLTDQTLYTCINDFVEPKLKQLSETANNLRRKTGRTRQEEKELEKLADFEVELKDFRYELLRIAKFWKPNLNDGVQITAAPLWKLFQHKSWQKKLKETWKKLEKGEYDWSHLAYSIWPDRVIRASHKERSYAIAHDLESDLWEEIENGKDRQGNPKYKWVSKDLNEQDLKAIIIEKSKGKI